MNFIVNRVKNAVNPIKPRERYPPRKKCNKKIVLPRRKAYDARKR